MTNTPDREQSERSERLHAESIVIDGSVIIRCDDAYIEEVMAGGITASNHTITRPGHDPTEGLNDVLRVRQWIRDNNDRVLLATTTEDIRKAKERGMYAVIFGPQDSTIIGNDLDLVNAFWGLGIRIMQITYQSANLAGYGCGVDDKGLTAFGRELIDRMNDVGMLVDLSHSGPRTTMDAIERSRRPVLFTHTHPRALADHIRCKSDEAIKAMAETGGVMGITGYSPIGAPAPGQRPDVDTLVSHIEYVADLVGIDHIGLGLDHDETSVPEKFMSFSSRYPELTGGFSFDERRAAGINKLSLMPNMTAAMVRRGFTDTDIKKVLGLNFMRVFGDWDG